MLPYILSWGALWAKGRLESFLCKFYTGFAVLYQRHKS